MVKFPKAQYDGTIKTVLLFDICGILWAEELILVVVVELASLEIVIEVVASTAIVIPCCGSNDVE